MNHPGKSRPERFLHLYDRGYTATAIARMYGIEEAVVRDALNGLMIDYAPGHKPVPRQTRRVAPRPLSKPARAAELVYAEPPRPQRSWCGQCERLVCAAEARQCSSRWCKSTHRLADTIVAEMTA